MAALNAIDSSLTPRPGVNGVNGTGSAAPAAASAATSAAATKGSLAASAKPTPAVAQAAPADQAKVSSTGGLVSQALNTSDVRAEKVSALQTAIADGSYNVSSSDVANKIVDSLLK